LSVTSLLTDCAVVGSEELSVLGLIVGGFVGERVSSTGDPSSVDDILSVNPIGIRISTGGRFGGIVGSPLGTTSAIRRCNESKSANSLLKPLVFPKKNLLLLRLLFSLGERN